MEKLGGEEKVGPVGRKKGKERNIRPWGERAGFKSRLQIYWRAFSQAGLHLTFSSASSVDSQLFPSHRHCSLHLPAANYPGFLNKAEPDAARDPKGFWMGFIQVTRKRGTRWLNILGGSGRETQGAAQLDINPPIKTKGIPNDCRPGKFESQKKVHK